MTAPKAVPNILVSVSPRGTLRSVLSGVLSYAMRHGPWHTIAPPEWPLSPRSITLYGEISGAILSGVSPDVRDTLEACRELKIPAVCVMTLIGLPETPTVVEDEAAAAEMGTDHLTGLGLRNLAFYDLGIPASPRATAFCDALRKRSLPDYSYKPLPYGLRRRAYDELIEHAEAWLASVPKPVGVYCQNPYSGQQLLTMCHRLGLGVPEDVAILTGGEDDLICELSVPPLSALDLSGEAIGVAAAECLHARMRGQPVPAEQRLPPRGIIARQSTDVIASRDRELAAAVRFIRSHLGDPIGASDVVAATGLSRRMLEYRFRERLDRSIGEELLRQRMALARQLLAGTELGLKQIAVRCGYRSAAHFCVVFRRATNYSPGQWRSKFAVAQRPLPPVTEASP